MKTLFILFVLTVVTCFQNIFAQPGWHTLTSGISTDLNAVYFVNANYGFAAGDGGVIIKTTNGGSSWTNLTSGTSSDIYDLHFFDANNGFAVGAIGLILRTTNGGSNWNTVTSGTSDNLYSISIEGTFGLIGGSSQTILSTTDAGSNWNVDQTGFFGGGFWAASAVNSTTGFVGGENSIFQPMIGFTTNSGTNWDFSPFYLNGNEGRIQDCNFFNADTGITASSVWDGQGAVSITVNGGVNWTTIIFPQALFGLDFPSATVGYAVGYQGFILKTTNTGFTWTVQTSNSSAWLRDVNFTDNFTGYAVGEGGVILKTTDGGVIPVELTSFTAYVSGENVTLHWSTATESNNYGFEVQRQVGSKQSAVGNEGWEMIGFVGGHGTTTEIQSYSFIDDLTLNHSLTPTLSYRLKQIDFDGTYEYSSVIEVSVNIPEEFSLEQNYPNPFNPVTTIKYGIPNVGTRLAFSVSLKVYDVLGNEVATLVNDEKQPGIYEVEFNANNLSSGVYYYQLKAGSFVQTKKMVLLK